jgi:hypothetical protein
MDHLPPKGFGTWDDPGFSPRKAMRAKSTIPSSPLSTEENRSSRKPLRSRWRTRSLLIALLVVWLALLLDPSVGRMLWEAALGFGITLAVIALAMGLGLMGFGLFAVGDRFLAWLRAGSRWPDDGF